MIQGSVIWIIFAILGVEELLKYRALVKNGEKPSRTRYLAFLIIAAVFLVADILSIFTMPHIINLRFRGFIIFGSVTIAIFLAVWALGRVKKEGWIPYSIISLIAIVAATSLGYSFYSAHQIKSAEAHFRFDSDLNICASLIENGQREQLLEVLEKLEVNSPNDFSNAIEALEVE